MTVIETSKRIGISPSKLYQLVAARKIGHYRIGGKIIFHEDDIAAFLADCRITTVPTETAPAIPRLRLKHINLSRGS
jgi:excisionase family DNA binding protein